MTKLRTILLDGAVLFAVSTVFVVLADLGFKGLKGKGMEEDPLVTAIGKGEVSGLKEVLAKLKDESGGKPVVAMVDEHGRTALMRAAYANLGSVTRLEEEDGKRAAMVEALLGEGAALDARDRDGWTALMWAAWSGLKRTADGLLKAGADVGVADAQGNTALIIAAQGGHAGLVEALLAKGADRGQRNAAGLTALEAARAAEESHKSRMNPLRAERYQKVIRLLE